jgi:hypothetical protein
VSSPLRGFGLRERTPKACALCARRPVGTLTTERSEGGYVPTVYGTGGHHRRAPPTRGVVVRKSDLLGQAPPPARCGILSSAPILKFLSTIASLCVLLTAWLTGRPVSFLALVVYQE